MSSLTRILSQFDAASAAAALILLLMACLGPLYFGSVLPRERIALQVGAFMALAAVVVGRRWSTQLGTVAGPVLAIAAIGCFGFVQSLPWPKGLVDLLAPWIAESWEAAADLTGAATRFVPLSLAPSVTRETAVHWLAVAACLAAAAVVGRERRLRRLLATGLAAAAVFEIVYGSDNWFARRGTIWGLDVGGDPTRLRGTFVNPDHLALFLTIATTGGLALMWWSLRRVRQGAVERRLLHAVLPSLLFLMLFVGLAFTGSRAGLTSMVLALVAQALLLVFHYRRWHVSLISGGALVLGFMGIAVFGLQKGLGRFMDTSAYEVTWSARQIVYDASWDLWRLSPWTGTGLGTFRQAFPKVQPSNLELTWLHAHSDVLELMVTTGLVGLPVAMVGFAALCRRLWRVFQQGRRSEDRAVGLWALGAVVGALAHSMVDFGLTIPANAFTLAIVCGLACGTSTLAPRVSSKDVPSPEASRRPPAHEARGDAASAPPADSARSSPPP